MILLLFPDPDPAGRSGRAALGGANAESLANAKMPALTIGFGQMRALFCLIDTSMTENEQ
ncbi:MAG TPA: hypothetical protein VG225_16545 [Terracidiphilus sp.]|jgi:hypothetical protein|nr:hypothetical protein [Terracidiphilus sp.]